MKGIVSDKLHGETDEKVKQFMVEKWSQHLYRSIPNSMREQTDGSASSIPKRKGNDRVGSPSKTRGLDRETVNSPFTA
jgi:hypothetical protein